MLKRREKNELLAEMEIFKLREEENRQKIELQDDLVTIFVTERVQNPYLREEILKTWNSNNRKEMEKVVDTWRKKISGLRKKFEEDRDYIKEHNKKRIKQNINLSARSNRTADTNSLSMNQPSQNDSHSARREAEIMSEVPEPTANTITASTGIIAEETENNIVPSDPTEEVDPGVDSPMGNVQEETVVIDNANVESFGAQQESENQTAEEALNLEEVESDEYFSEEEEETNHTSDTQILFGERSSTERREEVEEINQMVNDYFSTSEDETDDEEDEPRSVFRSGYNLRNETRKARSSYPSTGPPRQEASQQKRKKGKKSQKSRNSYAPRAPPLQKKSRQDHQSAQKSSISRNTNSLKPKLK